MEMNRDLIAKAKAAKTVGELMALAKENGTELTEESAKAYFEQLHPKTGELSDEELDNVAGGCSPSAPPKYHVGDYVKYYYQYEFTWTYECTATGTSFIEDIKADGSTWMYKLEAGSWDGAEYIKEDRIISLA